MSTTPSLWTSLKRAKSRRSHLRLTRRNLGKENNSGLDSLLFATAPGWSGEICFTELEKYNCSRLEGREGEDEGRGEGLDGAVGFSDNFANIDVSNLPKDPPPYTR